MNRSCAGASGVIILMASIFCCSSVGRADPSVQIQRESVEISEHYVFNTQRKVDGATILVRDFLNGIITATISTTALRPRWVYSIWWAVFNYPEFCTRPYLCNVQDLEVVGGNDAVKASVFYGGGFIADPSGSGTISLVLFPGRTNRELFAMSKDYGLQNLEGAEIHVLLRSHGENGQWGSVAQQLGSANAACPNEGCAHEFSSIHPPRKF